MPRAILILGLCGSGKTHLARILQVSTGARVFEHVASDPQEYSQLLEHLRSGLDAIVEEVTYCDPLRRDSLLGDLSSIPGTVVKWIRFRNDLDTANWNVRTRMDKTGGGSITDHIANNLALTLLYHPPEDALVIPICRLPDPRGHGDR